MKKVTTIVEHFTKSEAPTKNSFCVKLLARTAPDGLRYRDSAQVKLNDAKVGKISKNWFGAHKNTDSRWLEKNVSIGECKITK